jgi:uncharacterized membrane protein YkoI
MKRLVLIAALAASTALPAVAAAQDNGRPSLGAGRRDQDQAREGVRSGRLVSLSRVLAMIEARTPGRHLNTTQGDAGGRPAYFVQWQMTDGRVVIFVVDAESGQMLGRQGG